VVDVGDVDGAADDLVALRHGGAAVVPAPPGVAVGAEPRSPLLLQAAPTAAGSAVGIRGKRRETRNVAKDPYPGATSSVAVAGGREPYDAPVARRRGDREPGVGGGVVAVRGRGERRGRGEAGGDGGGEGGRDELLGHGVELGEEVLQIPHLALAGVGARLLGARRGGGLDDGHRSNEGGGRRVLWKVRETRSRRRRGGGI
jgi:hypothetical protein